MQPVQYFLPEEAEEKITQLYGESKSHLVRHRAHAILMWTNYLPIHIISRSLKEPEEYVTYLIKAYKYFNLEGLLSDNFEEIIKKIQEIEKPKPIPQSPSILQLIQKAFIALIDFLFNLLSSIIGFFFIIFSYCRGPQTIRTGF